MGRFCKAVTKAVAIDISCILISTLWGGYVLTILWKWFIVATLHFPQISIPSAIGLLLVVSFMTHQFGYIENKIDLNTYFLQRLSHAFVKPLYALGIGWIVHQFM